MIKKTIYPGNPYYLCVKDKQLGLQIAEGKSIDGKFTKKISLEDTG